MFFHVVKHLIKERKKFLRLNLSNRCDFKMLGTTREKYGLHLKLHSSNKRNMIQSAIFFLVILSANGSVFVQLGTNQPHLTNVTWNHRSCLTACSIHCHKDGNCNAFRHFEAESLCILTTGVTLLDFQQGQIESDSNEKVFIEKSIFNPGDLRTLKGL